jgi:hypothetical protein
MTISTPHTNTDHMIQICRERSARGVATRADWQRLADIDPERARTELISFLKTSQDQAAPNPFDTKGRPHTGLVAGFVFGMLFMAAWWLFGDYLQREVITTARQWDVVTFTQYVAASLLPVFAWLGWRYDQRRVDASTEPTPVQQPLSSMSWDDLLARFDATRKAGGTRMY